jgi:hypothetical protein
MSSFKIDLKTVEELRSKHSQLSSRLSSAANQLSSAAYGVDPAIKSRRQLHYRLSYATQRLRGLEDRMYNISDFMRKAIEQYESTEGQIKSKVGEITGRHRRSWLESLFDGVGDAYNALTQWLAREDGKRFTEQAKANAIAPANSCPAPEEPIDYRKFVGSHYWDNTKDGSFLYYEDYDGSIHKVDLDKATALLTEYGSALGIIYHSPGLIDPYLYDLTDFLIYTIHKGYDPRTFQPMDAQVLSSMENYINGRKMAYEIHLQKARAWESLALDMMPFVGQVKSLAELAIGENLVTGEKLDEWDYGLGVAGTVFSGVKHGDKLFNLFRGSKKLDDVAANFDRVKIKQNIAESKKAREASNFGEYMKREKELLDSINEGTGNLKFIKKLSQSADEVNDSLKTLGYTEAPYKPGTIVDTIELTEKTQFVRVYDGVNSQQAGGWVMKAEDIAGLTPQQIQNKFALPSTPKYVTDVVFESGTTLRTGTANGLFGFDGGGIQFDLMGQYIGDFVNPRLLP